MYSGSGYSPMIMMPHSANDSDNSNYLGVSLLNGCLVHRWLDGTVIPVLTGGDGDDDGGDGDGDDGGDDSDDDSGDADDDDTGDGDDDDDDESDEDDDADIDKITEPKQLQGMLKKARSTARRAAHEAGKYRTQRNKARQERDANATALEAEKAAHNKTKEAKGGDESLKAENTQLKAQVAELQGKVKEHTEEAQAAAAERQVGDVLAELNIDCDADVAVARLRKNGIKPDESGEFDDLEATIKRLTRKGVFKKKSTSGGDGGTGSSGVRTGRTNGTGKKADKSKYDRAALAKKYPALNR